MTPGGDGHAPAPPSPGPATRTGRSINTAGRHAAAAANSDRALAEPLSSGGSARGDDQYDFSSIITSGLYPMSGQVPPIPSEWATRKSRKTRGNHTAAPANSGGTLVGSHSSQSSARGHREDTEYDFDSILFFGGSGVSGALPPLPPAKAKKTPKGAVVPASSN